MKYASSLSRETWLAQSLILLVTTWNLQAAAAFILQPEQFAPGFLLTGVPGAAAVRGMGILFLMWNIPYLASLWNPRRNFLALQLSIAMQAVGLLGESYILSTLTTDYAPLIDSIRRFIAFDAAGLFLLIGALLAVRKSSA